MDSSYMDSAALAGFAGIYIFTLIFAAVLSLVLLVSFWKIFVKAGEPGWAAIIPIYNCYIMAKIAFGNPWFCLGFFIPGVNAIFVYVVYWKIADVFGKETGFKILTILFPYIALPILAFGSADYVG